MPEEPDPTALPSAAERDLDVVVAAMGGASRPGQHQMAQQVADSLRTGKHLLVQAGTGTGKSLGYVVPALRHAVTNDARIVISTATLALQRQVLTRDIPRAVEALTPELPREPQVALLKGWHHYVCLHKLHGGYPTDVQPSLFGVDEAADTASDQASPSGLGAQVLRARTWAEETDTGDRDDLDPGVSDRAWRQVSVTAQECIGNRCAMIEECFAEQAKRRAHAADVVVTNHAFVGLSVNDAPHVLPEYNAIIIDEAHELVDRVTAAAAIELSVGMIDQIAREARRTLGLDSADLDSANKALAVALARIPDGSITGDLPVELQEAVTLLRQAGRELLTRAGKPREEDLAAHKTLTSRITSLLDLTDKLIAIGPQDVVWCAREMGEGEPKIHVAPLDVSGAIRARLLAEHTAVLTSATLTISGSFDAVARSVGLNTRPDADGSPWHGLDVGSPFDYAKSGILYLAKGLPAPGRDPVTADQGQRIVELLEASKGGALGLFSSRRAAQMAVELVREQTDLPVFAQGEDQIGTLINRFSADAHASLFGTMSLWQGVDVAGLTNRLVIIDRIPFPRPDDPVMSARARDVERRGGNGFMMVSLQHAAIRLAQGAGRLIRSHEDRGVVAILDPRIMTKSYGKILINTLPPMWRTSDHEAVLGALRRLAP